MDVAFDSVTLTGTPDNNTYSQSITLSGTVEDKKSGVVAWMCTKTNKTPSASDTGWKKITRTNSKTAVTCPTSATENGEYYLYAKDNVGNIGKASYKVENVDRTIDSVNVSDTISGYRKSTILRGTALDTKAGIVGYAFTTSSSKPSTFTNITKTNSQVTFYYTADENKTYYFHVLDAAGNWKYSYVTVKDIVIEKTYYGSLSSYSSSSIEDKFKLDNPVEIASYTTDQGYINASLSGSYAYVNVYGGQNDPQPYTGTCSSTYYLSSYTASLTCSTGYYCAKSGTPGSDGMCKPDYEKVTDTCGFSYTLGFQYELFSCPRPKQYHICVNGEWSKTSGENGATPCVSNYHRIIPPGKDKDYYDCVSDGPCSPDGITRNGEFGCYATCQWDGEYPASCSGKTDYTCDSGDYKVDSDCYSCSYGSYSNGTCYYPCTQYRDYWEYSVTINYYVIK